jgi:hypothetical protein
VTRVADRGHQPCVDRRVVGQRLEACARRVDGDVREGGIEGARGDELQAAPDAVAHAAQVAGMVEQPLLDSRPDIRIGRRELERPARELLVSPQAQQGGPAGGLAAAPRRPTSRSGRA